MGKKEAKIIIVQQKIWCNEVYKRKSLLFYYLKIRTIYDGKEEILIHIYARKCDVSI